MGYMKRWFEEHLDDISDEDLMRLGYSEQDIDELRECFSEEEE
jgi:hypothetical protein